MASAKKAVIYNGPADIRRLGKEDFAKAGVELDKTIDFRLGHPFQVPADLHKALLADPDLFGNFSDADAADAVDDDEEILDATGSASSTDTNIAGSSSTVTKQ